MTDSIPVGLCQCGCGGKTKPSDRTHLTKGRVKGVPHRFICGHATKPQGQSYRVDDDTGCWNWQFGKTSAGYGVVSVNEVQVYAHTQFWESVNGCVPEGLELDHLCRNRGCVNPGHLEPVTHAENIRRGKSTLDWGRVNQMRSMSKNGTSVEDLSKVFEISERSAKYIIKGDRWLVP